MKFYQSIVHLSPFTLTKQMGKKGKERRSHSIRSRKITISTR